MKDDQDAEIKPNKNLSLSSGKHRWTLCLLEDALPWFPHGHDELLIWDEERHFSLHWQKSQRHLKKNIFCAIAPCFLSFLSFSLQGNAVRLFFFFSGENHGDCDHKDLLSQFRNRRSVAAFPLLSDSTGAKWKFVSFPRFEAFHSTSVLGLTLVFTSFAPHLR